MRQRTLWTAAAVGGAALALRAAIRRATAYDLAGKVVLVTGGSRGLGLVLARELIAHGARVSICARDIVALERARVELGPNVVARPCDITVPVQCARLVEHVRTTLGPIDVLINNAGVMTVGPMEHMTLADYEHAIATHVRGPLYLLDAILPQMRFRGGGRIVNIASIGGKLAIPHMLPYTASKFALVGLSEGLRAELAKDGIVVTTVVPGLMRTGSPRQAEVKGQVRKELAWFSVSDALPLVSISAERAARSILRAIRRGDAEVILSLPAKVGVWVHGLLPGLTSDVLGLTNLALPAPGGAGAPGVPAKAIVP